MQDAFSDLRVVELFLDPESAKRDSSLVRFFMAKLLLDPNVLPHIDRESLRERWLKEE